jgi:hypothetical protein
VADNSICTRHEQSRDVLKLFFESLNLAVPQVFAQDQVISTLFDGALRYVQESGLIGIAPLGKSLGDIGGDGNSGPTKLGTKTEYFLSWESTNQRVDGQHECDKRQRIDSVTPLGNCDYCFLEARRRRQIALLPQRFRKIRDAETSL